MKHSQHHNHLTYNSKVDRMRKRVHSSVAGVTIHLRVPLRAQENSLQRRVELMHEPGAQARTDGVVALFCLVQFSDSGVA
jgi:hypothetical protein